MSRIRTNAERFWPKVDKRGPDECWEWKASTDHAGYGWFGVGRSGKPTKAHRVSYEFAYGEFPKHLCVLHRCDNPPCVNPAHLFLGTYADNTADRMSKGRGTNPPRLAGEANTTAKLTDELVRHIHECAAKGENQYEIAARLNVFPSTVSRVVLGQTWAHLYPGPPATKKLRGYARLSPERRQEVARAGAKALARTIALRALRQFGSEP